MNNMGSVHKRPHFVLRLLRLFLYLILVVDDNVVVDAAAGKGSVSAVYVFGDSYVDPGNNNYIKTFLKSNYEPYGVDFVGHEPTGRFTNGRLVTDFLVSYLGIKQLIPPYLGPNLSIQELKSGVSFASSGTGFDILTVTVPNLIGMEKQANLFKECKTKLEGAIGKKATNDVVSTALYFVNAGINDVANNYFLYPIRPAHYTIDEYIHFLIKLFRQFLQSLVDQGARKFAVAGLPPLGCTPTIIDRFSENKRTDRKCIEKVEIASRKFNELLQDMLKSLQRDSGARFAYLDQYQAVSDFIHNPNQYGFVDINDGCCTNKAGLCLPKGLSVVCPSRSTYVFWDYIHLTEKTYSLVFESYRSDINSITST